MADPLSLPAVLPAAAAMPATVKAALPALTVMLVNGARDLIFATIILIIGWTISRWFGRWVREVLDHSSHVDPTLKPLLAKTVRYAILTVTIVAVLGQFGVQTTSLIALVGATALAIGLALQGTLSNVASGVMLLVLRPFSVGDNVVVGNNMSGTVKEVTLFSTVLTTADMQYVSLPNSQVFSNAIINYSREATRRINIIVGIDYDDDIEKAQGILLALMKSDARVLKDPAPIAPVNELASSSVNLIARCFVPTAEYWNVYFDLQKAIKQQFDAAGISIPFPQQVTSIRGGGPQPTA